MTTIGEAVTAILVEIIRSTIGTAFVIGKNLVIIFQILAANAGASPLVTAAAALIFAAVLLGVFKFMKGEIKPLIIAMVIFAVLAMLVLVL